MDALPVGDVTEKVETLLYGKHTRRVCASFRHNGRITRQYLLNINMLASLW